MSFIPDIVVREPDIFKLQLVAGIHLEDKVPVEIERELKQYVFQMHCSVGIILTPTRLRIYKYGFLDRSPDEIELAGDFPAHEVFGYGSDLNTRLQLESELVDWLDRLADASYFSHDDPVLNKAVNWYVVPAVSGGDVAVPHP